MESRYFLTLSLVLCSSLSAHAKGLNGILETRGEQFVRMSQALCTDSEYVRPGFHTFLGVLAGAGQAALANRMKCAFSSSGNQPGESGYTAPSWYARQALASTTGSLAGHGLRMIARSVNRTLIIPTTSAQSRSLVNGDKAAQIVGQTVGYALGTGDFRTFGADPLLSAKLAYQAFNTLAITGLKKK